MKTIKKLTYGLLAAAAPLGLAGCQGTFDEPTFVEEVPVAKLKANSTILEVKEAFWQDNSPYCVQVGTKDNGDHYIVKGRVISTDGQYPQVNLYPGRHGRASPVDQPV